MSIPRRRKKSGARRNRIILYSLIFLHFIVLPETSKGENEQNAPGTVRLAWKPMKGAGAYKLEIKNQAGMLIRTIQSKEPRVSLRLPPGRYYYRVISLNKFNTAIDWSIWQSFWVRPGLPAGKKKIARHREIPRPEQSLERLNFGNETIILRRQNVLDKNSTKKAGGKKSDSEKRNTGEKRSNTKQQNTGGKQNIEDNKGVLLEWTKVKRANSYVVEIKDKEGRLVLRRKLKGNRLLFDLPPGGYRRRVIALNRFDKPGASTPWQDFKVLTPREVLIKKKRRRNTKLITLQNYIKEKRKQQTRKEQKRIQTKIIPRMKAELKKQIALVRQKKEEKARMREKVIKPKPLEKKAETAEQSAAPLSWSLPVPGLPQWNRGERKMAGLYWGLSAALATFTFNEWSRADKLARARWNDPLYQLGANPLWATLAGSNLQDTALPGALAWYQINNPGRETYRRHKRNQRILGSGLGVLYIVHLIDALWFAPDRRLENPGTFSGTTGDDFDLHFTLEEKYYKGRPEKWGSFSLRFSF